MKTRHTNCQNPECDVCLEDALSLDRLLVEKTENETFDMLSAYRKFLDSKKIPSESKHGWPNENAYNDKNIDAFCKEWNGEEGA